jgi:hypothetical protein
MFGFAPIYYLPLHRKKWTEDERQRTKDERRGTKGSKFQSLSPMSQVLSRIKPL